MTRRPSSALTSFIGLPLSPSPVHYLPPDPLTPTVAALFSLSKRPPSSSSDSPHPHRLLNTSSPSNLRRSRQVKGAFSLVTPLPRPFPYVIKPIQKDEPEPSTMEEIESFLASLEPDTTQPINPVSPSNSTQLSASAFTSSHRTLHYATAKPKLLNLSKRAASDCLSTLDLGTETSEARAEMVKVLSGELVLGRLGEPSDPLSTPPHPSTDLDDSRLIRELGFGPWSLAYAGHQFGQFAGQLGDGRAISIRMHVSILDRYCSMLSRRLVSVTDHGPNTRVPQLNIRPTVLKEAYGKNLRY